MTWFKVDDGLAFHRKVVAAGNAAMGLWVRAGAWCAHHLTDGVIPRDIVRTMGKPSEVSRLVSVGLWIENDSDSYRFHDWFQSNPSRVEVEQRREAEAEKKAAWRARKAASRAGQMGLSTVDTTVDTLGDTSVRPEGVHQGVPGGVPAVSTVSRPDPTRPDPDISKEMSSGARKRATKAPSDFVITDAMREWATSKNIVADLPDETERFLDHHRAKGSTFKDWTAAWRTWMSRTNQYRAASPLRAVSGDGRLMFPTETPRGRAERENREYKPWEDY